jgi:hypothetical protein
MLDRLRDAFTNYETILQPDQHLPDWWAGAPSVLYDKGKWYLAARMRDTLSPRGRRGYEIRILESQDGISFQKIHSIHRDDVGVHGFERPALLKDPETEKFKLYGCGEMKSGWGIWKLNDVGNPREFDPKSCYPVIRPSRTQEHTVKQGDHHSTFIIQYKDPFIIRLYETWHMFVIGFDRVERPYHYISQDGEQWSQFSSFPILENTGWHNFYTRPACLLPLDIGYLLVYEGSNLNWRDPGYNIATGLSYTLDLINFHDLTPKKLFLASNTGTPYKTWRYSHWLTINKEIWVYYETRNQDQTNEIRLSRFKLEKFFGMP